MKFISSKAGRTIGVICCILVVLSLAVLITYPFFWLKIGGSPLRGFTMSINGEELFYLKKGELYVNTDKITWLIGRYYEGAFCASFPIFIFGGTYAAAYLKMKRYYNEL